MGIMKKESMKTNSWCVHKEIFPNGTVWKETQAFIETLTWKIQKLTL